MRAASEGGETVEGCPAIGLAGAQDCGGEMWDVDGVREVLGFEAKTGVPVVNDAAFASKGAIEVVRGVKLDARFGG